MFKYLVLIKFKAMKKTYVIGDIHGCYQSLVNLLDLIGDTGETLIFLGDYIDRGPDSKKLISFSDYH